jgi:flagellar motor switch protein FliM
MSGFLAPDEIAALVEAASEGRLPVEPAAGERRPRWLRKVDFTRPTKFSTEQTRRLTRVIEAWCRSGSTRMSAERVPMTLELLDVSQLTWTNAHAQVPADSVISLLELQPSAGRWVLTSELPLMLAALEALLGGATDAPPAERKLTDIDLVRRLFSTLIEPLSTLFTDLAGGELSVTAVDPASDLAYMENASEPTLVFTLEARLNRTSAVLTLMVPHAAIEPILSHFSSREDDANIVRDPRIAAALREGLGGVDVTARAEVADTRMTIGDVLALQAGDVVKFDAPAGSNVTVYSDRTPIHTAKPGRHGKRRAVQIIPPDALGAEGQR